MDCKLNSDLPAAEEQKKEHEQDSASKDLFNMMMNNANKSSQEIKIVDSETLVSQTQDRLWRALKRRFQYDVSLQPGQEFLRNHVSTKLPLVITYADLVGSTNMSMTLPADKLTTIIRAFTYEISQVIYNHKGFVLKYV